VTLLLSFMLTLGSGLLACAGAPDDQAPLSAPPSADAPSRTRVDTEFVTRQDMHRAVLAQGRTVARTPGVLRAPFAGVLADLQVQPGERVTKGQTLARLRATEGQAALAGAQALVAAAKTDEDRARAERALALAREGQVDYPLLAPQVGVVLSVDAAAGEQVVEGDPVLSVVDPRGIGFQALVEPALLADVAPGQAATVQLGGPTQPTLQATVRQVLPDAARGTAVPVLLDLTAPLDPPVVGLYGQARILVETHAQALTVPSSAVLVDDIEGSRRVARVDAESSVRWVPVETGLVEGERTEVLSGDLPLELPVIVSGQVGLPEGTPVRWTP